MDELFSSLVFWVVLGGSILVCALVNATYEHKITESDDDRSVFFQSPTWRFVQTILFAALLIAAAWRALRSGSGPDAAALSFLVLALIVILVPLVNKIVFPGSGEIDFITKQVKNDTVDLTQDIAKSQVAMATAAEVIARSQSFLAIQLRTLANPAARNNIVTSTLLDATATVADLFRPSSIATSATPGATPEDIRISAWASAARRSQLVCVIGWPDAICRPLIGLATPANGTDPASYVFQTSQAVNYPNIAIQERPPLPAVPPIIYKGILVVPMYAGGRVSGVLQIERSRAERFEPYQLNLARALSALYGMALS